LKIDFKDKSSSLIFLISFTREISEISEITPKTGTHKIKVVNKKYENRVKNPVSNKVMSQLGDLDSPVILSIVAQSQIIFIFPVKKLIPIIVRTSDKKIKFKMFKIFMIQNLYTTFQLNKK